MYQLKKSTVAGFVAASMVVAMLSPTLPAYALNGYGDNVTITFNTGDGPTVGLHDSTWQALTPGTGPDNSTTAVLSGQSGYLLTDSSNAVSAGLLPQETPPGLLPRPQLPDWSGAALDSSWGGYVFDGWYAEGQTKLERLHPAFPYEDVVYYARWIGNPVNPYNFSVKHLADVNIGGTLTETEFYHTSPASATTGTTVSTSYKRTIPGYKFTGTALGTDYDYAPRNMRKYGEASGAGTGKNVGTFNSSYVFMGTMPNDDLEVTYRYVADQDKKFNFRVEHINAGTGTAIASAQVSQKSVGDAITAAPLSGAALTGYIVQSSSITAGNTDNLSGSGIYGAAFAGGAFVGNNFSGMMPNQAVTITYEYIVDPTAQSSVTVSYIDDQGRDLVAEGLISEQTAYTVPLGNTVNIPVPDLQSSGYMQDVNLSYSNLVSATLSGGNVAAVTQAGTGTVTIMYVVNQSDTTNWARLTFLSGSNGSLQGNSSPRIVGKGSYVINSDGTTSPDVTDYFTIVADAPYYMGDGWYRVNPSGNPTGSKIDTLNLTGDMKLMYCFKEDPGQWVDISFAAGANGSINSSAAQHLKRGTAWDSTGVQIPSATANGGYLFLGWYDDVGNLVWDGQTPAPGTAFVTTTYTAKFGTIMQETGHDALNRPDASGALGGSGRGVITVNNPADNRRYIVTDMDGTVLAELTTVQINGGADFADLPPGSSYNVYEISTAAPVLNPGSSTIADVTSELRSYPARVIIPAVGDNAVIEADQSNANKAQIVIKPAAANTDYALLDENGSLVYDWVSPSGSPLAVVFDNLEPNTHYIVVAKDTSGMESAESKKNYGTDVFTDIDVTAVTNYMLQVLGGTVDTIDGVAVGTEEAQAAEGQAVKITAPAAVSGRDFKEWKVLLGNISGFTFPSQRTRTITMPAMNVVLAATYEDDLLATPSGATSSNASLEYKVNFGHEGEVALDVSQDKMDNMRADVTTAEDVTLLGQGRDVTYRIQFTKRQALATESNAVKAERSQYDDAYKTAFALDVKLLRFVDGQSRPVADGTDPGPVDILIQIDAKDWEHLDYQLWQIDADGTVSEVVPLSPDPNTQPEYGGYFLFTGEVNSLYVLSYSKTNMVTVTDSSGVSAGNNAAFRVRRGEGLADSADYQNWSPVDPYTDAAGTVWSYVGLSKKSGIYKAFDDTEAIKKNKTVYTYYESHDADWNDARKQLEDEISRAGDLMNNGSVSQEDKDRLQAAIDEAEAVLNQYPRATIQELEDAYNMLKEVVDSITGFTPPGTDDDWLKAWNQLVNEINTAEALKTNSKVNQAGRDKLQAAIDEANKVLNQVPQPTTQELTDAYKKLNRIIKEIKNSIGSKGGGGGSSSGKLPGKVTSGYPTYTVGVDGNWQLIDEDRDSWIFVLNSGKRVSGTWAYLVYEHNGTKTSYYYHFGADGVMHYGWYLDADGRWYYLSRVHDGWFGHMKMGWHYDEQDLRTYYLDTTGGHMLTGWKQLDGTWYYFNPQKISHMWGYNASLSQWEYLGGTDRPYGSMYAGEQTPDGYRVDDNGALAE